MKVTILGAGPAGLYTGILLARAAAGHEVTVLERNAPDATFGWGVVFSDETLGALRDADHQTYAEITDTFARWDAINVRYRGELLRSRGHAFSAISRALLLDILQRRCRELGAELRFHTEVEEPAAAGVDLLVGADGVNSAVRRAHEDAFGTRSGPLGCKFAWFGTHHVFDSFTFAFRESEHGVFQAHAYPFDERTSTFIVECPEETWRRAGLDAMDEAESMSFCADLFAEDLAGNALLSNRSIWMSFLDVRNETWHHGNSVLVGDAAHTAHFTIGSGTKLAMEDAIALTGAVSRHADLATALTHYELERQPVVERFQEAARVSAGYFERVGRLTHLEPPEFAFNLLTRSGRISHGNLAQRDPSFVRALDAWFAGRGPWADGAAIAPPPMFAPLRLGTAALPNRVAVEARDATPASLAGAARAGAGLVIAPLAAVSPEGRVTPETPVLGGTGDWAAAVDAVHSAGALAAVRIGHAGRRGATCPRRVGVDVPLGADGWPLVAASAIPYGPGAATPAALAEDGMREIAESFATGARHAADAGFDVLVVDMAHGHLLAGFLSPLANRREDEYGGTLEGRLRFPLRVLDHVRAAWPHERPLGVRLTVTDWAPRGLTVEDGIASARAVHERGTAFVEVAAGQTVPEGRPDYRRGFLTQLGERVRTEARVATLVGGWLTTPDEVNTIVAAGRGDLCLLELEPA
jgi:anthraniloyl-CoA monooxygenase